MTEWDTETAEWYAANYGDYPTNRLALERLDLPDHATIVDVGCGTGSALRHAALMVSTGTMIGIDPVPRMIEIAEDLTENHTAKDRIQFRVGSAEELPVDDKYADLVFAFDSVDHWHDVQGGLKEVQRILLPTGMLIIVKDKGVPGANQSLKSLKKALDSTRFEVVEQKEIRSEDVGFVLWICKIK